MRTLITLLLTAVIGLSASSQNVQVDFQNQTVVNLNSFNDISDNLQVTVTTYDVTFQVDMNNEIASSNFDPYTEAVFLSSGDVHAPEIFNYCGMALTDSNNDGIYDITRSFEGSIVVNYRFHIGVPADANTNNCDPSTGGLEPNLPPPCGNGAPGDRFHNVDSTNTILPPVCYGSCDTCGPIPTDNNITFQVDMNNEITANNFDPVTQVVFVTGGNANPGELYSFCGDAMTDSNNDGVYELTRAYIGNAVIDYKFYIGSATDTGTNNCDGVLPGYENSLPAPCGFGAFGDRQHNVNNADATLPVVCFSSCDPCGAVAPDNDITFQVDMNNEITNNNFDPVTQVVFVTGGNANPGEAFSFCGDAMTDANNDGVYELTRSYVSNAIIDYKFYIGVASDTGTNNCDGSVSGFENNLPAPCGFGAFGDRQHSVAGADAVLPVVCFNFCTTCASIPVTVTYTFSVDMNCSNTLTRPPAVTGPFWGWCDGCNPMTDPDGDDIWEIEIDFIAGQIIEYKYQNNGWAEQEDLVDDMVGGADCAPVTDFYSYANRQLTIDSVDQTVNDTYGSCDACPVCLPILNISGNIPSNTYQADDVISSNGQVNTASGGPVSFYAGSNPGEYIVLISGFDCDGTVDFEAVNIECDPTD